MKKNMARLMACGLCVTMLTGCGGTAAKDPVAGENGQESGKTGSTGENIAVSTSSAAETIAQLKEKYAAQDTCDYTDPLYNLEADHEFTYEVGEKFFDAEEYEAFKVFYDGNLENMVDVTVETNYDDRTVTIKPNITFDYKDEQGSITTNGTWGTRSKFWLVQYIDTETGKELDHPIVTVFSIQQDMDTPTLKQGVNKEGYYQLNWSEVEGADSYEVYSYDPDMDFAVLELETEDTSCDYGEFNTTATYDSDYNGRYDGTEVDTEDMWSMNRTMDPIYGYFVVAKSDDGDYSGMSNECYVKDIANQIPYMVSDEFQEEYTGDSALALPAYVDVKMIDGSIGQYLIEYHGAKVAEMQDGSIVVNASLKNLPISMQRMVLTGVDYDDLLDQADELTERGDDLETKSADTEEDVDIPYVPQNDDKKDTEEDDKKPQTEDQEEKEEPEEKEDTDEEEPEEKEDTEDTDEEEPEEKEDTEDTDEEEPEEKEDTEDTDEEEPEEKEDTEDTDEETPATETPDVDLDMPDGVAATVYEGGALSEWIGLNLLAHQETISLNDFPEASDSEYLTDVFWEASTQNPLLGKWDTVQYDYESNSLLVSYSLSAEDTKAMQEACIGKAKEIAGSIITEGMSDYEKEAAINAYLCDNASYNNEIMDYVNEDGTIDPEAAEKFVHSFTPYGILVENFGVCESYAEAFQMIAREAGLQTIIETGSMSGVNHEWNRINLDGNWYTMDVTNNDNDYIKNALFNLSDETASTVLKQGNEAVVDANIGNYTANDDNSEYYRMQGMYTEDASEAASKLAEQLKSGSIANVRMNSSFGGESLDAIVGQALTDAGIETGKYYSFANVIAIVTE